MSASLARFALSAVIALVVAPTSWAHVLLDSPNGGETLTVGSTFKIQWYPSIQHDTINWDLWYSTANDTSGPWQTIAMNLPVISPVAGTIHTYDWLVPNVVDSSVWIRVLQDDNGEDYDDVSDASFSIVAPSFDAGDFNENGAVNSGDLVNWEAGYGRAAGALHTHGDADKDGDVDGSDFLAWQRQTTGGGNLIAVPEPTGLWPIFGCWILACRPRNRRVPLAMPARPVF